MLVSVTTHRIKRGRLSFILGLSVLAASCVARSPLAAGSEPRARRAASTTYLSETAKLHLVSHQGTQILHEEGQITGTLHGRLVAVIDIGYTQATVTFTATSTAGTLSGRGTESYYVAGKNGHFDGQMTVTAAAGRYARAKGSGLQTTGLIKRAHYEVLMTVNGKLKS